MAVVPLVILATSMVFSLILLLPGDPAVALVGMEDASEEKLTAIRKRLGHRNLQTTLRYAEQSDAVADAELGPFLIVEDEGDRKSRIIRPLDVGGPETIANQVARHGAKT